MALMQQATQGAQAAAGRGPGADFDSNGGYLQTSAQEALARLYGIPHFTPPGFQGWDKQSQSWVSSPYQQNMLPNPRMAR